MFTLRQDLIIGNVDGIRQTLKSKQCKQVFLILRHVNCPSKRLKEQMIMIEPNIVLVFVLLLYLPSPYKSNLLKDVFSDVLTGQKEMGS